MSQIANETTFTEKDHEQYEAEMLNMVNKHATEVAQKRKEMHYQKEMQKWNTKTANNLFWLCMGKVFFFLMVCFIVWVCASFVNVTLHNSSHETAQLIWKLNFFTVMF